MSPGWPWTRCVAQAGYMTLRPHPPSAAITGMHHTLRFIAFNWVTWVSSTFSRPLNLPWIKRGLKQEEWAGLPKVMWPRSKLEISGQRWLSDLTTAKSKNNVLTTIIWLRWQSQGATAQYFQKWCPILQNRMFCGQGQKGHSGICLEENHWFLQMTVCVLF